MTQPARCRHDRCLVRVPATALGLLLLCATSLAAQGVSVGVRAGVSLASLRFEGEASGLTLDSRIGGVGGLFVTFPLVSWLELQPEVLYAMKGARLDDSGITSQVWLDYVEVPVLVRYSRPGTGAFRYYLIGGPSFGVRVRARTRTDFGGATEEIDISDEVERTDLTVIAGGGVEFRALVVDARYSLGLSDIDKDKTDAVTASTRAFAFTVGVKF